MSLRYFANTKGPNGTLKMAKFVSETVGDGDKLQSLLYCKT
jgi:hypothetical protein